MLINSLPYKGVISSVQVVQKFFPVTIVLVPFGLQCMHLQIGDQFAFPFSLTTVLFFYFH